MRYICIQFDNVVDYIPAHQRSANFQAESDFDLNKDSNAKFQPTAHNIIGRVVGIKTYLSLRERPTVNSREIMRIPNGAELNYFDYYDDEDWYSVNSVTFGGRTYKFDYTRCYVNSKYVMRIGGGRG